MRVERMYVYRTITQEHESGRERATKDILAGTLDGGVSGDLQTHVVNVHRAS